MRICILFLWRYHFSLQLSNLFLFLRFPSSLLASTLSHSCALLTALRGRLRRRWTCGSWPWRNWLSAFFQRIATATAIMSCSSLTWDTFISLSYLRSSLSSVSLFHLSLGCVGRAVATLLGYLSQYYPSPALCSEALNGTLYFYPFLLPHFPRPWLKLILFPEIPLSRPPQDIWDDRAHPRAFGGTRYSIIRFHCLKSIEKKQTLTLANPTRTGNLPPPSHLHLLDNVCACDA